MDRCEICGGLKAYFVCSRCGRDVCSGCFHPKSCLCSLCANTEKIGKPSALTTGDLFSAFGRLFPLGIAFIFAGMILTVIASILSAPSGGGFVIIFPFFIGTVSETSALAMTVIFIIISLTIMFLPWILGPRRVLRAVERIANLKTEDHQLEEAKKEERGEIEDYLITLRMPGFKEDDIRVRILSNDLIVQAFKDGEVFRKTYELPRDFEPRGVKYNYEADFLIIRVTFKPKGGE